LREALEECLRKRPFIEEALSEDLINLSSLARLIKADIEHLIGKEINESAVVMAIRRREPRLQLKMQHRLQQFIGSLGDIIVRSNLEAYTYKKTSLLPSKQAQFIKAITNLPSGFHSFTGGMEETTVVVSQDYTNALAQSMAGEQLLDQSSDLSSITLRLPDSSSDVIGLYYYFFKHIASAGVPIKEIISTTNEATFIVHNNDVNAAFATINTIKRPL
ncbi:MAG: aspartate kinase, partial [Schleiferiaceae bacterium]|nr:aspartate kinase [Schleiferiaceae bacterium]